MIIKANKNNISDYDIALDLLQQNSENIIYISDSLKNNKRFAQDIFLIDQKFFPCLSEKLRDDADIVLLYCTHRNYLLEYSSKRIRNNINIFYKLYRKKTSVLQYFSEKITNSNKIKKLILNDLLLLEYSGNKIKDDLFFILKLIKKNYNKLVRINENITGYEFIFRYGLSKRLQHNILLAIYLIELNPTYYSFLPENLQKNTLLIMITRRTIDRIINKKNNFTNVYSICDYDNSNHIEKEFSYSQIAINKNFPKKMFHYSDVIFIF